MSDVNEWLKERRTIHDAATGGWEHDEEDGGNFWAGGVRSDFHLTPEDARSAVDAHNTLPALLTAVEKVLEVHQPKYLVSDGEWIPGYCKECYSHDWAWPCATVQAIEGAISE